MRTMRRADFAGEAQEGLALLERAGVVHLATTGNDGQPILRVVHPIVDRESGVVAFHAAPAGEKMEGLGNPAVISAHEIVAEIPSWFLDPERACPATTFYVSVQVDGTLEPIDDLEVKARILQTMMTKYQPEGRHAPLRADDPLYRKAIKSLLVAGLPLERVVCKAKLGQNRRLEERRRIVEQLWQRGASGDVAAVDLLSTRYPEIAPPFLRDDGRRLRFTVRVAESELEEIADLLDGVYWLEGVPRTMVIEAVRRSSAVVVARNDQGVLVGFARALSDGRVAWICDVIVRDGGRRSGIGTGLVELLLDHPAVRGVHHVRLRTRDAEGFYRRLGFATVARASRAIEEPTGEGAPPQIATPGVTNLVEMQRAGAASGRGEVGDERFAHVPEPAGEGVVA